MLPDIVMQLPFAFGLLALCGFVAIWKKNRKRAALFAGALLAAMAVTTWNPVYTEIYFFAIYAGTGAIVFFLLDWKAGALLCLVSMPGAALAFGFISQLERDIFGEIAFACALVAGVFLGPSGGYANRRVGTDFSSGNSSNVGVADGNPSVSKVARSTLKVSARK